MLQQLAKLDIIMKQKIIIALFLNVILLLFSGYIFISKGISKDFIFWKFSSSLFAIIVFGTFILLLLRRLKQF